MDLEAEEHNVNDDHNVPPPSPSNFLPNFDPDLGQELDHGMEEDRCSTSPPIPAMVDSLERVIDSFPGASTTFEKGETFLSSFDSDPYAVYCRNNLYYPFTSHADWKMANYLLTLRLSMSSIDEFFDLEVVRSE